MKGGDLRGQAAERRSDGVELDLFNLRGRSRVVGILVNHIIRTEETQGEVLVTLAYR